MSTADSYPPAPWDMHGQLFVSLFRLRTAVDERRPAGLHAIAFVDYEAPSPLTYSELLVAHPVKGPAKGAVSISDIWVDSAASVAGGRELWAIPKGPADFSHDARRRGPLTLSSWSASLGSFPVCSARFRDLSRFAPRVPFKGRTWQPGLHDGLGAGGGDKTAALRGSARALPAHASWDIDPAGPLGWLAGHRPLVSFRMTDFAMKFG